MCPEANSLSTPLSASVITSTLSQPQLLNSCTVLAEVNSTNSYLQALTKSTQADFCITEVQTQGKGRRGNQWTSLGHNISCSLRWSFTQTPDNLSSLAMVTSLVCAKTLKALGYTGIKVKWPNDLIANNKKLGGILVENFSQNNQTSVIIGIGINGKITDSTKIDQAWTDLSQLDNKNPPDRNIIVSQLLNNLLLTLENYETQTILQEDWGMLDWVRDQKVTLYSGKETIHGVANGIDNNGALKLKTSKGTQLFYSGDISLRKA